MRVGDALYRALRDPLLRLARAPEGPPDPPAGSDASLQVFRASPRFLAYRLLVLSIVAGVLGLAVLVALALLIVEEEAAAIAGLLAAVVLVLAPILLTFWFSIRLDYDLRYYMVTDRSLRVREGALIVREKTLTFANVQNLDLHQGPIQRLFGISDLVVETAGGGAAGAGPHGGIARTHGARVAGVENAREIRELIRGHLHGRRDSGLGDPDDEPGRLADAPTLAMLSGIRDEAEGLRRVVLRPGER